MIATKYTGVKLEVRDNKTNRSIAVDVSPSQVRFYNEHGTIEFTFSSANSPKVRNRWRNVIQLLSRAVTEAERATDKLWPKQTINTEKKAHRP